MHFVGGGIQGNLGFVFAQMYKKMIQEYIGFCKLFTVRDEKRE